MHTVKQNIDKIKAEVETFFATQLPRTAVFPVHDSPIASLIDHTALLPTLSEKNIQALCQEAITYSCHAVCIPPRFISFARQALGDAPTQIASVIGFPMGYSKSSIKRLEALKAVDNGATEIDMVIPIGALKNKQWQVVRKDIQAVVDGAGDCPVKVILETGFLQTDEIIAGCMIAQLSKARFVKTSTGFGPRGVTMADIQLMHAAVGGKLGIKASGGIRDFQTAKQLIRSGATRIGTSASINIIKGAASA